VANVLGNHGDSHINVDKVLKPRADKRSESSKRQRLNDEADSAKFAMGTPTKSSDLTLTNLTIDMNFEDTSNLRERRSLTRNHTPQKGVKHLKLTAISPGVGGLGGSGEHEGGLVNVKAKKNLLMSTIEAIEEKVHANQSTPKKSALKKAVNGNEDFIRSDDTEAG